MATADRLTAVVFFALGLAMLVGGYTMDRLSIRQIHPLSIPGLVPMLLGAALALCAVILLVQSRSAAEGGAETHMARGSISRLMLTAALTFVYAAILVGWLPFFWATAIFIAAFMLTFSWPDTTDQKARILIVIKSFVFAGIASYAIVLLFREAFLVRLP